MKTIQRNLFLIIAVPFTFFGIASIFSFFNHALIVDSSLNFVTLIYPKVFLIFYGFFTYLVLFNLISLYIPNLLEYFIKYKFYLYILICVIFISINHNYVFLDDTPNGILFSKHQIYIPGDVVKTIWDESGPYAAFYFGCRSAERYLKVHNPRIGPLTTLVYIVTSGSVVCQTLRLNTLNYGDFFKTNNISLPGFTTNSTISVLESETKTISTSPGNSNELSKLIETDSKGEFFQVFDFSKLRKETGSSMFNLNNSFDFITVPNRSNKLLQYNNSLTDGNESPIIGSVISSNHGQLPEFNKTPLAEGLLIGSPLEENEIKLLFLKEVIGSELILTRCAIYFVFFLFSMITIILLTENKDRIQTVFDKLDKIPLGFILKYFLKRALLGNRQFKIFLIYGALFFLAISTVSLFIGLLKCYAVLV